MRSLSSGVVLESDLEVQEKIQEMRSSERCHHHKQPEAALETRPLTKLGFDGCAEVQGQSLEKNEIQ